MPEEIEVFADRIKEALEVLVESKQPLTEAPINKIREMIDNPNTTTLSARKLIRYLVEAGYNVKDIMMFFEEAGIIKDSDDWTRFKMDIERAVILANIEKETGGDVE